MSLKVDELTDEQALTLLLRFLQGHVDDFPESPSGEGVRGLLGAVVDRPTDDAVSASSDGELARDALSLLVEEPEFAARLDALHKTASPGFFLDPATLILTSAAALVVLQLSGVVSYDQRNGWRFKLEKKPASDSVMKSFITGCSHDSG